MRSANFIRGLVAAVLAVVIVATVPAAAFPAARKQQAKKARAAGNPSTRVVAEKNGVVVTREGLRLRLVTDLGDVHIRTVDSKQAAPELVYKVHIETDSADASAKELVKQFSLSASPNPGGVQLTGQVPWHGFHGRLWVTYDITVPRHYSLDVTTQVGNIETQDIDGRVSLVTLGGNIIAGRIGLGAPQESTRPVSLLGTPMARLETQGGHITVQDVNGDLRATTAGGHINAGNVQGDAVLHTGGGNIRAGTIGGVAQLETGGGNISIQRAGGGVTATSAGGQIEFGDAAGAIRARTGGGAIRVLRVSGPMQLASNGGSIVLTQVRGGVRASTGTGNITAWFAPEPAAAGYITPSAAPPATAPPAPTQPSGTTPAPPQAGGAIAKPAPRPNTPRAAGPLVVSPAPAGWKLTGASQLEAAQGDIVVYIPRELAVTIEAVIEMGGENRIEADPTLPLKVRYVDSGSGTQAVHGECTMNGGGDVLRLKTTSGNIRLKLADTVAQAALYRRQIGDIQRRLAIAQQRLSEQMLTEQEKISQEMQQQLRQAQQQLAAAEAEAARQGTPDSRKTSVWYWDWPWAVMFSGDSIGVDPAEQQKRLISGGKPPYPAMAREAGVEGTVRLRVLIDKDGAVQQVRLIGGPPSLASAAIDAVKQWRYQPAVVNGKPVSVVTTVAIEFKLD